MTVAELIDMLSGYNPKTEVYFSFDYGDHSNTKVCLAVEDVEEDTVVFSEYHRMHRPANENDYDSKEDKELIDAVILSG